MLTGVNYWPARTFVRMWDDFDARQVRDDFAAVAACGMRLVRCFVFWPSFQPAPGHVDAARLERLRAVFELAWEQRLLLMPALLVGHMSGPNWMPPWAMSGEENNRPRPYIAGHATSDRKPRDIFGADAEVLAAERLLVRTIARAFRDHPTLWGWDVCNEIDLVQLPERAAGERWLATVVADIHAEDPHHPVTAGFLTWPDDATRGFARSSHRLVDVASVHAYPLYDARAAGPGDVSYVARAIEETRAAAGVPVMLSEFGMPTNPEPGTREVEVQLGRAAQRVALVDEQEAAAFVRAVLPAARDAGAEAALIWCFSDYDPALYAQTPFDALVHERYFGIFDARGRLKATGEAMRDFARGR